MPQNLGISPVAAAGNDPSLGFEWQARQLGSNRTWGCIVTGGDGQPLTVVVTQSPYVRALKGAGSVEVTAIPVAADGVQGRLVARNELTGASAEYSWTWGPIAVALRSQGPRNSVARASPKAQGTAATAAIASVDTAAHVRSAGAPRGSMAFFGLPAVGNAIAFVLDMSGSMAGKRWSTCVRQLKGVLETLGPEADVFVVLFSTGTYEPPGQADWTPATPGRVAEISAWIDSTGPAGGTDPHPAFTRLSRLSRSPTTVFFLTDGQFGGLSAQDCSRMTSPPGTGSSGGLIGTLRALFSSSSRGAPEDGAAINTITLDDDSSGALMKDISSATGGRYVHATSDSDPS